MVRTRDYATYADRERLRKIVALRDAMRADLIRKQHRLDGFDMALRLIEQADVEPTPPPSTPPQ